jgi:hypothetical protein
MAAVAGATGRHRERRWLGKGSGPAAHRRRGPERRPRRPWRGSHQSTLSGQLTRRISVWWICRRGTSVVGYAGMKSPQRLRRVTPPARVEAKAPFPFNRWSITMCELQASPRWSAETKARAGVIAGIVMSVPLTLGIGLPYVYWLLTGRGPWRRYGLSSSVVVNPLSRRRPSPEIREALTKLATASSASCSSRMQAAPTSDQAIGPARGQG